MTSKPTTPSTILVETSKLRSGSVLRSPLHDSNGVLLLNGGKMITEKIKQGLLDRNIEQVALASDDAHAVLVGSQTRHGGAPSADKHRDAVAKQVSSLAHLAALPMKDQVLPRGKEPYSRQAAVRLANRFHNAKKSVELMANKVVAGANGNGSLLAEITQGYTQEMSNDLDQVLTSSGQMADVKVLAERSLRLSLLSMAVGIEMNFDAASVCELGIVALVHDWGLLCMPERLRGTSQPFHDGDWELYMQHPMFTFDALDRVSGLAPAIRIAAAQVHELCDGSGYPRGLGHNRIHRYARIVGVVDAYLALTETRRGRPAVAPHDAMACLLHQLPLGRFDTDVTKALLYTLSLFPLGSYVHLTGGQKAIVIRRSSHYAKPVVRLLDAESGVETANDEESVILALAECEAKIVDIHIPPGKMEMRLDRSLMYDVVWDGPEA